MAKHFSWVVAFALVVCAQVSAGDLTLNDLQSQLKRQGASWQAGETSVSKLSKEEQQRRLGAILPEGFGDHFKPAREVADKRLPASLDWRNVDGVNFDSPVLNQGSCGSCVAFATVGVMETQMNITRKTPYSPWAYSSQHLFSCGGGKCAQGWHPTSAMSYLKATGIPDEACFPYKSGGDGQDVACTSTCGDSAARSEKIVSSTMPTFFFVDVNTIKKALQTGPLVAVMMVYEDFLFYKGGIYKQTTGNLAGGHAVAIVGYDDATNAWIVKNSWGEDWGEKGYFRIDRGDTKTNLGSQTFGVVVPGKDGYVGLGIRDNAVLFGKADLTVESTYPGLVKLELELSREDGSVVWWGETDTDRIPFDTKTVADGTYLLKAKALGADSLVGESQPRRIHVLNGQFNGSVAFTDVTEGKVFTAQAEIGVATSGSPISLTKVIFRAKNLATGEVSLRATPHVLPQMKFIWRAQLVPNGEYELTLEGQAGPNVKIHTAPVKVKVEHP